MNFHVPPGSLIENCHNPSGNQGMLHIRLNPVAPAVLFMQDGESTFRAGEIQSHLPLEFFYSNYMPGYGKRGSVVREDGWEATEKSRTEWLRGGEEQWLGLNAGG